MSFLDPRVWAAIVLACVLSYGTGRFQQWQSDKQAQQAALLKVTQAARETEQKWQTNVEAVNELHAEEVARIAADRDRAVAGLRNRPARLPETARAACAGSTGAELSERDAGDLVRLAARADEVRTDLEACRAWIGAVTK